MTMWRSRTLWLFGLTLSLGAGCVSGDDDATMSLSWRVGYVDGGGVTCKDAGTPTVRLLAVSHDTGQEHTFDFDCSRGRGITREVPAGLYDLDLFLLDAKGRPVAGTSGEADLRRHGSTRLDPVNFEVQSWLVAWAFSIEQMGSMRPGTCDEVGVSKVEFITQQAGEAGEMYVFDCKFGQGATAAIQPGTYAYKVRLMDAAGKPLNETPVRAAVVDAKTRPVVKELFPFK